MQRIGSIPYTVWMVSKLVLNLVHSPLYRHFCKRLYIEFHISLHFLHIHVLPADSNTLAY